MNLKRGLSGASLIFAVAILSACGGSNGGSSGGTPAPGDSTTPPSNTGTTPPADNSAGDPRPSSVAGFVYVPNFVSDSISAFAINASTGALAEVAGSPFATGQGPWDLKVHTSGKFVYIPNNESDNVSVYTVDVRTGALSAGPAVATGTSPTYMTLDPSGQFAYVGNGGGAGTGSISAYRIDAATGALSEIPGSPLATGYPLIYVTVDPSGRFLYATCLANDDSRIGRVISYTINPSTGALTQTGEVDAGNFPQSITFEPLGRFAYVPNSNSSSISAYSIDSGTGALSQVAGSPFRLTHYPISITADTAGKFLYVPRGDTIGNSYISILSINSTTGALSEISGSPFAMEPDTFSLAIAPSGRFAYVGSRHELQMGGSLTVYAIDASTGTLTNVGATETPSTSYNIVIDPSGRVAYSINGPRVDPGNILAFTLNATNGQPNYIGSSPTGVGPGHIKFLW